MAGSEIRIIEENIWYLRMKLQKTAKRRKLTDPIVINVSQMLDRQLNEYERLIRDNVK